MEISKKMEAAFAAATNGTMKDIKSAPKKNVAVVSAVQPSKNLETKQTSFLKESSTKENKNTVNSLFASSSGNSFVNAAKIGAKEASILALSAKKEIRRETYVQESKAKRDVIVNKRRSAVDSHVPSTNPFQNLVSKTPNKKLVN